MDLQTALEVKRELEAIFATRIRGDERRKFALGVATPVDDKPYRVAVRAESENDLRAEELDFLREHTEDELDVRVVGLIQPMAHRLAISRGAAIGASVAHYNCSAGSLGFFAQKPDGTVGFVSNNHVIAADDQGKDGDEIFFPAPADGGRGPTDTIGFLDGSYPRLKQANVQVDCAFARLARGKSFDARSLDAGLALASRSVLPMDDTEVCKIGRTTGFTVGRVSAFELDPSVRYSFGRLQYKKQIEIESTSDDAFSRGGDSGSLIFTKQGEPVGLLFAASAIGGHKNTGLTFANPIDSVLAALGVTILT